MNTIETLQDLIKNADEYPALMQDIQKVLDRWEYYI